VSIDEKSYSIFLLNNGIIIFTEMFLYYFVQGVNFNEMKQENIEDIIL